MSDEPELPLTDRLALDRTVLAIHRTWLAFARTSLAMFVSGVTFAHLFPEETPLLVMGWLLGAGAIPVVILGWRQYRRGIAELDELGRRWARSRLR